MEVLTWVLFGFVLLAFCICVSPFLRVDLIRALDRRAVAHRCDRAIKNMAAITKEESRSDSILVPYPFSDVEKVMDEYGLEEYHDYTQTRWSARIPGVTKSLYFRRIENEGGGLTHFIKAVVRPGGTIAVHVIARNGATLFTYEITRDGDVCYEFIGRR